MELAVADKYVNRNQTPSKRTIYRFLGPSCHISCAMSQTIPLLCHQKSERRKLQLTAVIEPWWCLVRFLLRC